MGHGSFRASLKSIPIPQVRSLENWLSISRGHRRLRPSLPRSRYRIPSLCECRLVQAPPMNGRDRHPYRETILGLSVQKLPRTRCLWVSQNSEFVPAPSSPVATIDVNFECPVNPEALCAGRLSPRKWAFEEIEDPVLILTRVSICCGAKLDNMTSRSAAKIAVHTDSADPNLFRVDSFKVWSSKGSQCAFF